MRITTRATLCLAMLGLALVLGESPAAAQASGKTYMRKNLFYLPIKLEDRLRQGLQEVRLYMKDDPSKPWQLRDSVPPTQSFFAFRAERDGAYWFTVMTVDKQGQTIPADVQNEPAGLAVVLDTQPPRVQLYPTAKTPEGQVVHCEVSDENVAVEKTRFCYQTGDQVWRPLESLPQDPHKFCIPAQAVFTGMVRVAAFDMADNTVVHEINLASVPVMAPEALQVNEQKVSDAPAVFSADTPGSGIVPPVPPLQNPAPGREVGGPPLPVHPVSRPSGNELTPPQPPTSSIFDPPPEQPIKQVTPPAPPMEEPANSFPLQKISQAPRDDAPSAAALEIRPPMPIQEPVIPAAAQQRQVTPMSQQNVTQVSHQEPALNKHLINKRQLFLQYQIEQQGASGVGRVEIWLTRDRGQTWERYGEDADRQSPAEVMLPGEGLFGVSLVVSNGRGFGATPPASGDPADWWIEVDVTRPHAELLGVRPGSGEHAGTMAISWLARDSNLAPRSIHLSCAVSPEGPWQPIAKGLDNHGQYRWTVPVEVGPQAYIRLEAQDLAGNITETRTDQPVLLDDLSRPRARIRAISTGAPSLQTDN